MMHLFMVQTVTLTRHGDVCKDTMLISRSSSFLRLRTPFSLVFPEAPAIVCNMAEREMWQRVLKYHTYLHCSDTALASDAPKLRQTHITRHNLFACHTISGGFVV